MRKEITENGPYGSFNGSIVITFDYKTEPVVGHNPSTHDEVTRQTSYHKIEVFVDSHLDVSRGEFTSKDVLLKELNMLEIDLTRKLKRLANSPPIKTVEQELKEKGYK